jgi:hypothetical protein
MSHDHEKPTASGRLLGELVDEAREATREPDWNRVEASLFARVEREAAEMRALASHRGRPGAWLFLGGVAAAAAAVAFLAQPSEHTTAQGNGAISNAPLALAIAAMSSAGDLTLQKGGGEVLVAGAKARTGAHARIGETIGTHGARAVFEAPGRVTWLLEDESSVNVTRAGAVGTPVVLALRQGALEAQVAPVASGEAFAVDVEGVRVAVHGTHLRVARDGDHVVVDLSEGVVSIGAPPKSGSTYGTLVTAPAHIEFQADALGASLRIDHAAIAVRRAVDLDSVMDEDTTSSVTPLPTPPPTRGDDVRPTPAPQRSISAAFQPRPAVVPPNPNAESDIATGIRACAAAHPRSSDVKVTLRSLTGGEPNVTLTLYDNGAVRGARFDPPLAPDIQQCAQNLIFKTRFVDSAEHTIPISF